MVCLVQLARRVKMDSLELQVLMVLPDQPA
jgi:hypothetical protein